jgi:hypothetical protein
LLIVVSLPESQLSVTYYKPDKSPRLLAKRMMENTIRALATAS